MKKLFVVLFALSSWAAFAQAAASVGLTDLMYIPARGTVYGETGVHWDSYRYQAEGTGGIFKRDYSTARQKLGYGISDHLQLNVVYEYRGRGKQNLPGTGDDYNYRGSLNPEVGALYRVMTQGADGYNMDVYGSFSPDLWKAEIGNRHGTAAQGGMVYKAGVRAGKKNGDLEHSAVANLNYYGNTSVDGTGDTSNVKADSYYNLDLRYNAQYNFNPDLWVRGTGRVFTTSEQATKSGGTKTTQDMQYGYGLETALFAMIVPNTLALELGLNWARALDHDGKSAGETVTYASNSYGGAFFNFRYQF